MRAQAELGYERQGGIPETVAADTSGDLHQGFDFTRRQVLPAAALCVGDPLRRAYRLNNPIYEP